MKTQRLIAILHTLTILASFFLLVSVSAQLVLVDGMVQEFPTEGITQGILTKEVSYSYFCKTLYAVRSGNRDVFWLSVFLALSSVVLFLLSVWKEAHNLSQNGK